jgi:hypothetical protein
MTRREQNIAFIALAAGLIVGLGLGLILGAAPAQAHTTDELDAWVQRWEVQLYWQGGITQDLFMERHEMAERHPCYFWDQCPPPPPHFDPQPIRPQPPASESVAGVEQWRTLVMTYFSGSDVDIAMRVMGCESGGNPSAKNPRSTAAGLWQFLRSTWDRAAAATGSPSYTAGGPYDPVWATINAAWLRARGSGWNQWECY